MSENLSFRTGGALEGQSAVRNPRPIAASPACSRGFLVVLDPSGVSATRNDSGGAE